MELINFNQACRILKDAQSPSVDLYVCNACTVAWANVVVPAVKNAFSTSADANPYWSATASFVLQHRLFAVDEQRLLPSTHAASHLTDGNNYRPAQHPYYPEMKVISVQPMTMQPTAVAPVDDNKLHIYDLYLDKSLRASPKVLMLINQNASHPDEREKGPFSKAYARAAPHFITTWYIRHRQGLDLNT
jgi:hypothetical protein